MKRHFFFMVVVPLVILGVMAKTGQLIVADSRVQLAPTDWPSNIPKGLQTGTGTGPPPYLADLSISKTDTPDPAILGSPLTYTITISNDGFVDSTGVILVDALPLSVDLASVSASQGSCIPTIFVIICDLDTVANGLTATVTIVVTPTEAVMLTNSAAVTSTDIRDPDLGNNSVTEETQVGPAGPGLLIYLPILYK